MSNNRELSQFASFVKVDDTTDNISFASTVSDLNVTGVSTFNNVTVGGGTSALVVSGDLRVTGIISAAQFAGEAVITENRIIQVGGATSTARAANLVQALNDLAHKTIAPGATVTVQLTAGEYFFTEPLRLPGQGSGVTILGHDLTGIKPGRTGNHYYNQAGIPDGMVPGAPGIGLSVSELDFDATSPSGAYPNPMVGGRGYTSQSRLYNEGIINTYYGSKLKFFDCDGIISHSNGSAYTLRNLAIIGAGNTALTRRRGVTTTDNTIEQFEFIPEEQSDNVDDDINVIIDPDDMDTMTFNQTRQQRGGQVILRNVDVHNFFDNIFTQDNGGIISVDTSSTNAIRIGFYSLTSSTLTAFRGMAFNCNSTGFLSSQNSILAHGRGLSGNHRFYGALGANSGGMHCGRSKYYNNGRDGLRVTVDGFVRGSNLQLSGNGYTGVLAAYGGNFVLSRNTLIACNNNYGARVTQGGQGLIVGRSRRFPGIGLTVSYNAGGVRVDDAGYIRVVNTGITSNRSYGIAAIAGGRVSVGGTFTEVYDNRNSTAGSGSNPTTIQIVATGDSIVSLSAWNNAAAGRSGAPAALSPNIDVIGNGKALIYNRSNNTFVGTGDTSYPFAVESGT